MADELSSQQLGSHSPWHDPEFRENAMSCGRAVIAAIEAAGYVVVPLEPTEKMIEAGDDICPVARGTETYRMSGGKSPEDYYRAMIAARPR